MPLLHPFLRTILAILFFSACSQIVFENPQPQKAKTLHEFPESIRGDYTFSMMGSQAKLRIGSNFIRGDRGEAYLSDSLILKEAKGVYILNRRVDRQLAELKGTWETFVFSPAGCGFIRVTSLTIADDKMKTAFEEKYRAEKVGDDREAWYIVKADDKLFWELTKDSVATLRLVLDKNE